MSTDRPVYTKGFDLTMWEGSSPQQRQIFELKHKYKDELFAIPGVNAVGAGKSALKVTIDPDASARDKARIPRKLEGCDVEVIESGRGRPASKAFDSRIRPLVGATRVEVKRGVGKVAFGMLSATAEGVFRGRKATYIVEPLHVMAPGVTMPTPSG